MGKIAHLAPSMVGLRWSAPRAGPRTVPCAEKALGEIIRQLCTPALGEVERDCCQQILDWHSDSRGGFLAAPQALSVQVMTPSLGEGICGDMLSAEGPHYEKLPLLPLAPKNKPLPYSVTLSPASQA